MSAATLDPNSRLVLEAMRSSRDSTLDAAIELCEAFARDGHTAACCVAALRSLKESLPRSEVDILDTLPTTTAGH